MKKLLSLLMLLCLTLTVAPAALAEEVVNVYNWEDYIAPEVLTLFTEETGIKVNYMCFTTNEDMIVQVEANPGAFDVCFPSDYIIERMIAKDLLAEINYDNVPNFEQIIDKLRNPDYDPENKYSVPYTWGTVGIIYNTKYVDEADVTGWELLWNEKYAGKILMFDNSRDAFGIAEYLLGYDVNTTDEAELQACSAKLAEQKPVVQQYVMDQIFDAMENEEAWIAPYYAGDYLTMVEENPDLAFYRPTTQGYNMFIDAMCIPTCCQEKDAAEAFINFLCSPEISSANMEFLGYSVPSTAAKELMDPEVAGSEVAYPDADTLTTGTSFNFLPEETSRYMESLFMEVRNG